MTQLSKDYFALLHVANMYKNTLSSAWLNDAKMRSDFIETLHKYNNDKVAKYFEWFEDNVRQRNYDVVQAKLQHFASEFYIEWLHNT